MTRIDPISLRLPEELKTRLESAKDASGRSLNAEIRMRLEWSFEASFETGQSIRPLDQAGELEALRAQVSALEKRLETLPDNLGERIRQLDRLLNGLERGEIVTFARAPNKEF